MRPSPQSTEAPRTAPRPRRRPPLLWTLAALAGLAIALGLTAPSIVAYPPLCNRLIHWLLRESPVEVVIEGADLRWWRAPDLRGVAIRDAQGELLARITRLRCDRSLLHLLRHSQDLGRIELRGPVFYVRRTPGGINWLDVGRAFARSDSTHSPQAQIRILAGQIVVADPANGRRNVLGPCVGELQIAADRYQGTLQVDRPPGRPGDPFAPKRVVDVAFQADRLDGVWRTDAQVESDFAQIHLQGNSQHSTWSADWDLARTFEHFGTLLPPDCTGLSGDLHLEGTAELAAPHQLQLAMQGQLRELRVHYAGGTDWQEPLLDFAAQATRPLGGPSDAWTEARLTLSAGNDSLSIRRESATDGKASPWQVDLVGDLASWQKRLTAGRYRPAGTTQGELRLTMQLHTQENAIYANPLRFELEGLQLTTPQGAFQEPRVIVTGELAYNLQSRQWTTREMALQSTSVAFRAQEVQWSGRPGDVPAGRLAVRADLERLQPLLDIVRHDLPSMAGGLSGTVAIDPAVPDGLEVDLQIDNLRIGDPPPPGIRTVTTRATSRGGPQWEEPSVHLELGGGWASSRMAPQITQLSGEGIDWQLRCSGLWDPVQGIRDRPVVGQLHLRGDRLQARLAPQLRGLLDVQGPVQVNFTLQPPSAGTSDQHTADRSSQMAKRAWLANGQMAVEWDDIRLLGMPLEGGPLQVALQPDTVAILPAQLPLAGGQLQMAGRIDRASPYALHRDAGPLLDRIHLDPATCHRWLKYVAPLLADATQADGTLSVHLEDLVCPLGDPAQAHGRGVVEVHQARLGPGPLAQQLLAAAHTVRAILENHQPLGPAQPPPTPWVTMPAQRIAFVVEAGQVRHEQALFQVDDLVLRTSGRVGLDQSLSIVAQVPIQDAWLDDSPWLQGLRGQSISVPITGSLANPRLDRRALAELSREILQRGAAGAIQHELENQLRRLLERN